MTAEFRKPRLFVAVLAGGMLLAGCGGESEMADMSGSRGAESSGGGGKPAGKEVEEGSVRKFGVEATDEERRQATRALGLYLQSLAAGEWTRACSQFSATTRRGLERFAAGATGRENAGPNSCPQILSAIAKDMPLGAVDEAADIKELSLRVEGVRAQLFYKNREGKPSQIAMSREGGKWRVAAVLGTPQPYDSGSQR